MEKVVGVYCIKNIISGKMYVGSSINIFSRIKAHFYTLRKGNHCNNHLQKSFNKHEQYSFVAGIIEECSHEIRFARERYWVLYHDTLDNGYNLTIPTEDGGCPRIWTPEQRLKQSETIKQSHVKMSESTKLHRIEKMKESIQERKINGTFTESMEKTHKSKRKKIKIYDCNTYEFIEEFNSSKECADYIGITLKKLTRNLGFINNGRSKTVNNKIYTWRKKDYKGYIFVKEGQTIEQFQP